ncbi:TPA: hypothetical protein U1237_001568 [Streptococcus suis]|nr:hypothetical protein [Streptococcus suis]HEM5062815.1 hypothetical protein [Streptococcus suis]HEM5065029.1 hypothetical protein [Streptococcus suis]HEM5078236.1 hypothetical protein [Streptococcus suis]
MAYTKSVKKTRTGELKMREKKEIIITGKHVLHATILVYVFSSDLYPTLFIALYFLMKVNKTKKED